MAIAEKFLFSVNEGGRSVSFTVWALPGPKQKDQVVRLGLTAYAKLKKQDGYVKKRDFLVKKLEAAPGETYRGPCVFDSDNNYALPQPHEKRYSYRVSSLD